MPIDEQALAAGIAKATDIVRRMHALEEGAAQLRVVAEKAQAELDAALGDVQRLRGEFEKLVRSFLP